jgi:acyl dehydratase
MNQSSERYLEDFAVGQTFGSGRLRIAGERGLAFAAEFDPQPFHLDEAAARRSIFGGLTASGWHATAVTMRLLIEGELQPAGGFVGVGLDERRWPRPVRPGDELRVAARKAGGAKEGYHPRSICRVLILLDGCINYVRTERGRGMPLHGRVRRSPRPRRCAYCSANSGACPKGAARTTEIETRSDVRMLALLTQAAIYAAFDPAIMSLRSMSRSAAQS